MANTSMGEYTVRGRCGPGDSFQLVGKVLAMDHIDALRRLYADNNEMQRFNNFLVNAAGGNPRLYTLDKRPHFSEL